MNLREIWVIIFFEQVRPQSEGSRCTDPGVKLPPVDAAQRKAQPCEPLVDDYETDVEFYE